MIFDTDVLIWYLKGNAKAKDLLASVTHGDRQTSVVSHMELLAGNGGSREVRAIDGFLRGMFSHVVPIDEAISSLGIRLMRRHAGADGLRPADALIAATALARRQPLATANVRHYRALRGLRLVPFLP